MSTVPESIISALPPVLRRGGRSLALALAGSLLLCASAKIEVNFWPVPATMQSLVVLLLGCAFGTRQGIACLLAYLAEGLAGLPVFAGSTAGPAYMAGPTGGYLAGFLLAVAATGWLAEHGGLRGATRAALTLAVGHALMFIPGVLWLAVLVGWPKAVAFGLAPFIGATLVKTAMGVALLAAMPSLFGRPFPRGL